MLGKKIVKGLVYVTLKNFHTMARTDMGRWLDLSNNEPSIYGETLAVFQRSGKVPEEMLRLKLAVKD